MSPTPQLCRGEYALVHHDTFQSKENKPRSSPCSKTNVSLNLIAVASLCCLVAVVGFFAGRYSRPTHQSVINCKFQPPKPVFETFTDDSPKSSVENLSHIFRYNHTFAENSQRADQAWKDVLPPQNGYFSHPKIAPQRSTLSVYHQLHCLVCTTCLFLTIADYSYRM